MLGDPDCPICKGVGFIRMDLPLNHPDFGKVQICSCRTEQVRSVIHRRLYEFSNLAELKNLTFENFQPRGRIGIPPFQADSIETAYNQSRLFAQSQNGWLLLQGNYGCGKTHLAAAIANFAVSLGVDTLFVTVPDMLDSLRFAYQGDDVTFEKRFEEIRSIALLILDDFGTQNATSWAQEKLFQILNYRYINRLPLVVTTNLHLDEIEERIRSRLLDPRLVTKVYILASDYRNPVDEMAHSRLSSLANHKEKTFSSFSNRQEEGLGQEKLKNLEKVLKAALNFSKKPSGWLVFMGETGCGKTHLAAAIGNYRAEIGEQPIFVYVPELLDHLRATFNPNSLVSFDRVFDEIKHNRLLILDGFGVQSQTPWVREKLNQLIDHRYNAKLATVITMRDTLEDLYATEPGIASRLMDRRISTAYMINAPDYRRRHKDVIDARSHGVKKKSLE